MDLLPFLITEQEKSFLEKLALLTGQELVKEENTFFNVIYVKENDSNV